MPPSAPPSQSQSSPSPSNAGATPAEEDVMVYVTRAQVAAARLKVKRGDNRAAVRAIAEARRG